MSASLGALSFIDLQHVVLVVAVWAVLTFASLAVVVWFAATLPEDYFQTDQPARSRRTLRRVVRNIAGVVLFVVGAAMSLPGVPGQGMLTMLVGIFLVDFPQRTRLERALARRPGVLSSLNRLRARFNRPPLRPPPP